MENTSNNGFENERTMPKNSVRGENETARDLNELLKSYNYDNQSVQALESRVEALMVTTLTLMERFKELESIIKGQQRQPQAMAQVTPSQQGQMSSSFANEIAQALALDRQNSARGG